MSTNIGVEAWGFDLLKSAAGANLALLHPEARDFDFLHGRWLVTHRKLSKRLAESTDWIEFSGTLDVKPILAGLGNIDENVLEDPTGRYLATSIRVFRPVSGEWSIHWVDGRSAGLENPVMGRFNDNIGQFYGDDIFDGRPIRVRFTYQNVSEDNAKWDQAFSLDEGKNWEVNWTMEFTRERLS